MSAATVRAAIQAWTVGGNIAGLNAVYKAQPWFVDGQRWNLAAELGSGAVAFVHLAERAESRITLPALEGNKAITYTAGLVVLYQYLIPTEPASEDVWVDPLDAVLEAIVERFRADPTFGTAGSPIFQAAQDPNDCRIVSDLPRRTSGVVQSWNVVEFHCTEIIVA